MLLRKMRQWRDFAIRLIGCALLSLAGAQAAPLDGPAAPIRFVLTFDDGPSGSVFMNPTAQVLDTLAHNDVQPGLKAIFFIQTRAPRAGASEVGQSLLRREQAEGHLLAFHTATPGHSNHRRLGPTELEQSLQDGSADLQAITGVLPTLVRPPFWNYDERTFTAYQRHGMGLLLTDLSANDGKVWGVNFSLTRRRNMLKQLAEVAVRWRNHALPVVDGATPIVVTFHDINTYTARHAEEYLHILLDSARALDLPLDTKPFYDEHAELERAALARTVRNGDVKESLPGLWNWIWQ